MGIAPADIIGCQWKETEQLCMCASLAPPAVFYVQILIPHLFSSNIVILFLQEQREN